MTAQSKPRAYLPFAAVTVAVGISLTLWAVLLAVVWAVWTYA